MALGPFDVTPAQIVGLKERFSEFINALLEAEVASHGLSQHKLTITSQENTPDAGVDAVLNDVSSTNFLPWGDSAWQFKRSNLGPKACAKELEGATDARDVIGARGSYVLVLGIELNPKQVKERHEALFEKAIELKLLAQRDRARVRVYGATKLAQWATCFPALAVSPLLARQGLGGIWTFSLWSSSRRHRPNWVPTADRQRSLETIRATLTDLTQGEIRIDGPGGAGKTRLVMEAVGDPALAPLVAYVSGEASVGGDVLGYMLAPGRSVILVVDEYKARSHEKLAEMIPSNSTLKLVTIGEADEFSIRSPRITVAAMSVSEIAAFLQENYVQLREELRHFVGRHCAGNVRFAILLADRILEVGEAEAADLIRKDDLGSLTRGILPEGQPFFLATVLALLDSVGWDGELAYQAEALAEFAGATPVEFQQLGRDLEARGLLSRQGRYRSVSPHPVAVYLAAEAWRGLGKRVLDELLPSLDREMALGLLSRAADLGRYEPTRQVLRPLLGADGPFGSLANIELGDLGKFVTQLAIVMPQETVQYLAEMIEGEALDVLRAQTRSRRDLVWALEKLAWHSKTFERAADCLLRLALAENETYTNNATGTWLTMFHPILPTTGALPQARLAYLRRVADSVDANIRKLAVAACDAALDPFAGALVSGEVQGGASVEPRGAVGTWDEAWAYWASVVDLLGRIMRDPDPEISKVSLDALVRRIHYFITLPVVADRLWATLAVDSDTRSRLRVQKELEALRAMHAVTEVRKEEVAKAVDRWLARLPPPSALERLEILVNMQPWEYERTPLLSELEDLLSQVVKGGQLDVVLDWLQAREVPSAWYLGVALKVVTSGRRSTLEELVRCATQNAPALAGFLQTEVQGGDVAAFDELLDSKDGRELPSSVRMYLSVVSPQSATSRARVIELVAELPVAEGAQRLAGRRRELTPEHVCDLVRMWEPRLSGEVDYTAVLEFFALWTVKQTKLPDPLRNQTWTLLQRRVDFPLRKGRWDWCRLGSLLLEDDALRVANLVLDNINVANVIILNSDDEAKLLAAAARIAPAEIWQLVAERLEHGEWRLEMTLRGWFTEVVPIAVLAEWIGQSVERAKLVARIAHAGEERPSPIARLLLDRFGTVVEVGSSLAAEYYSGGWVGHWSERLGLLIKQLRQWETDLSLPVNVRRWATQFTSDLERQRIAELEREQELFRE